MYTKTQLADMYGIHRNTMSKRIIAMGIKCRCYLTPKQVRYIMEELGEPLRPISAKTIVKS